MRLTWCFVLWLTRQGEGFKYITYCFDTKIGVSGFVKGATIKKSTVQLLCVRLKCGEVLRHVAQTVEVAADAAEVTEGGQQPVQPQTTAEVSVFDIRLTQLGISFAVRRQANVLTQSARLLDEMHVCHDLWCHLAEPLGVDSRNRHWHKEDEDLVGGEVAEI